METHEIRLCGNKFIIEVKAPTTLSQQAAHNAANARFLQIQEAWDELTSIVDIPQEGRIDWSNEAERSAVFQLFVLQETALRHIVSWNFKDDAGNVLPIDADSCAAFIRMAPVGQLFNREMTALALKRLDAKNG